jgi:hypothetical protein
MVNRIVLKDKGLDPKTQCSWMTEQEYSFSCKYPNEKWTGNNMKRGTKRTRKKKINRN